MVIHEYKGVHAILENSHIRNLCEGYFTRACSQKCTIYQKYFLKQGPVVQKPINANLGLNLLKLGLNFNPRLLCVVQS